jgi:hypothetical protein
MRAIKSLLVLATVALVCGALVPFASAGDDASKYERPGFITRVKEGRLWVHKDGQELGEKHVTLINAGPGGMTLKAPDRDTALEYLATRPGFRCEVHDGRIHVWKASDATGEMPEKRVTRIGAGPLNATVIAEDRETLDAYLGS